MKDFNDFLLKFSIDDNKLKMEISLDDLVFLFENCPDNMTDYGDFPGYKIKPDKK